MRDKAHGLAAALLLMLSLLVAATAMPAAATAPQPVLPLDPGPVDDAEPGEDGEEAPPDADTAGCLLGPSAAAGTLASYPGPVVPIPSRPSPCQTRISLSLLVESPDERRPQGADAGLDGRTVSRAALEAGFVSTLPASSRTISLTDPGPDWEITEVGCTCGGGSASMRLASYPGPVIPVPTFDSGARPGSSACGRVGGSGSSLAATPSLALSVAPIGELATYPRPVIPLPGGDGPAPPTEPQEPTPPSETEEPERTPVVVSWSANGSVSIIDPDALGGAVSCRWKVELVYGDLTVKTKTKPRGSEGEVRYIASPASSEHGKSPQEMAGSSSGDRKRLWKGAWSVAMQDVDERLELTSSSCEETDATTSSSASGATATIGLDGGDRVTCTFELKLLAPRAGRWNAKTGKVLVSCGVPTVRLPPVTESGTMKVRRNGDVLIARGLAPGSSATWRLRRDVDDPRQYSGKITWEEAGNSATFDTQLRLINEKRMKGSFSGKMRLGGERCTFRRPLTLTYAGR